MQDENVTPRFHSPWRAPVKSAQAVEILGDIVERLHSPETLQESIHLSSRQSRTTFYVQWNAASTAMGDAGLALLDSYLDACFPEKGWDQAGHVNVLRAGQEIQSPPYANPSLGGGLSGLALTTGLLSRNGTRYQKMLASLDERILSLIQTRLQQMKPHQHGFSSSQFDVIAGLSGIGRYLLSRADIPEVKTVLDAITRQLIAMSSEEDGVPSWYVPPQLIMQEHWQPFYPVGLLDSGLAHGVAGPLALLALVKLQGEGIEGIDVGIDRMASWLSNHRCDDDWGINWGTAYPIKGEGLPPQPSRCAWCYGSPGIARALWLAGEALNQNAYRDLAVQAMEAVYSKPIPARQIDAPGLCHGVAGLLQITLRFAHDTHLPMFQEAAQALVGQLITLYEPNSLLGYRDQEYENRLDRPDLLNGTIGVALAFIGATQDKEPVWDSLLLLS